MSEVTAIQWADSTVNPIMGCAGCKLFPNPKKVLREVARAMNDAGDSVNATEDGLHQIFRELVDDAFRHDAYIHESHQNKVTTTNIWHLRERFAEQLRAQHNAKIVQAALEEVSRQITCYAGKDHLNKGTHILDREGARPGKEKPREFKEGFAPTFEAITQFKGRSNETAAFDDLIGCFNPETPWKGRLPRLIFVSDMGDALSSMRDFPFLKSELIPAVTSESGKKHLWLWLTKRPGTMSKFADEIGGLPENVCAMTTLTGPDEECLERLDALKRVKANIRGLSIEPLWDRIPLSKLDLKGIDWVIAGGESGSMKLTRPFALEWAEELRDHCRQHDVAFFLKQLGRNPSRGGKVFRLKDSHGGNWDEWPDEALKIREFPISFHNYRKDKMKNSTKPRPVAKKKGNGENAEAAKLLKEENSKEEKLGMVMSEMEKSSNKMAPRENSKELNKDAKAEFDRLHNIISNGVRAFVEAGAALKLMHDGKLWKAGGFETWKDYCRSVAGISRAHAHRLMQASECVTYLKSREYNLDLPISESQVRPLLRLPTLEKQDIAWCSALTLVGDSKQQPTASQVKQVVNDMLYYDEEDDVVKKPPTRSAHRTELVSKIRAAVTERHSWEDIESLLADLEKLI